MVSIFGVIVSIVCPFMFCLQNLIVGLILNSHIMTFKKFGKIFGHSVATLRHQIVVLLDKSRLLYELPNEQASLFDILRIACAHAAYLILPIVLFIILTYASNPGIICSPLAAPFLLNNNYAPKLSLPHLFEARQKTGKQLFWDSATQRKIWKGNYWKFENIQDLLNQFNFVGFHDVCVYPESVDIQSIQACPSCNIEIQPGRGYDDDDFNLSSSYWLSDYSPGTEFTEEVPTKGFEYVYPGYNKQNAKGNREIF